jgi:hypothetical protein
MNFKVTALLNTRRSAMMDGAEAGDSYTPSAHGPFTVEADSIDAALEVAFEMLNIGPAPSAARERSLSVGDTVEVDGHWFTCKSMGWAPLAPMLTLIP